MIDYNETVLDWLTDEYLLADASRSEGQRIRAGGLLNIPPHYRQGIESRVTQLTMRTTHINGIADQKPTGLHPEDALRQAVDELTAQGVKLRAVALDTGLVCAATWERTCRAAAEAEGA